jgi:hypothetical protein
MSYPPGLETMMQQMSSAFQMLADTQKQQLEISKRGQEAGQARSLKIEHKLPKVGMGDIGKVPFEISKFETELHLQKIDKWETWYSYLMSVLGEEPKKWVESRMTRPPLSDYMSKARSPNVQPSDWQILYTQVRWEILVWSRCDLSKPEEEAENRWKSLKIEPGKVTDAQYLYSFLVNIEEARQFCVMAGVFHLPPRAEDAYPGTEAYIVQEVRYRGALEKEMKGLEEKVPKGSQLYFYMYGQVEPQNFDQWIIAIRNFSKMLPQKTPLTLKANQGSLTDGSGNVTGQRFNNHRLASQGTQGGSRPAASGGYGGKGSPPSQGASEEALKHVPKCDVCKGRHMPGPASRCRANEICKARGCANPRTCDYMTYPHNVSCRGTGHERADHQAFMRELQARRAATRNWGNNRQTHLQNRRKGKGAKGSSKKGGKGKGKGKSKDRGRANLRPRFIPRSKQPNRFMYRSGQYKTRKIVKTRVGNVVDQGEPEIENIEADVEELIEIEIPENGEEAYGEYDEIDDWLIWGEPEDAESVHNDGLEEDEDQYEYEGYEFAFDQEGHGYNDAGQYDDQAQEETYEEQAEQQETNGPSSQEVPVRRAHFVEKWNDEEFPDLDESAFFAPSWSGDPDSRSVRMSNARLQ